MQAHGWYDRKLGHEELFDLYLDPWEACNRAADPDYGEVRQRLSEKLDAWMEATRDPFLHGELPEIPNPEARPKPKP